MYETSVCDDSTNMPKIDDDRYDFYNFRCRLI